ncbi:MAG: ATP-binding protein [Fibromonadaceae bacterium]|jgi:predicted AAA+ superfamily ATPase|nr:ATP-binding protein [Fibromonadaceae bacterium]
MREDESFKIRERYLKTLLDYKDKKVVKIITGIRRCGKSAMLSIFANELGKMVPKKQIIEMNFESMKFKDIVSHEELYLYIAKRITTKKKTYLLFDEIQMVKKWERAVNSFLVDFNVDIYITGSNAYLLSSELSTLISGRYVEIKMLPLSFKEFLSFNDFDSTLAMEDKFLLYVKYGGMPAIADYNFNEKMIYEMLEGVYNTVIVKDIMQRNKITDSTLLKKLTDFLAHNIGSTNSINSISNFLVSNKEAEHKSAPNKTIESYVTALQNAFVFYDLKRYDVKGKSLLKTLGKNYIVDIGIRNMLLGYRDAERGHILENIVFLELLRRGYKVHIGKFLNFEIDFIAETPKEKIYFQVSESLIDKSVFEREIAPLKSIKDNHEKVILFQDKNFITSYEGIKIKNVVDFLLE